jgi:hypothetical protein
MPFNSDLRQGRPRRFRNARCHEVSAKPLRVDGEKIAGAILMVDEQAPGGHYDQLTRLKEVPFVVANGACPGDIEDHLLVSDGRDWRYVEALSESWYPAVRVSRAGKVFPNDSAEAHSYWRVYDRASEHLSKRASLAGSTKDVTDEAYFQSNLPR